MQIKYITLLVIFFACTSVTDSPKPDNADSAREAFESLDEEVGVTQVEKDLSGLTKEATGSIRDLSVISDPTTSEKVNIIQVNQDG